MSGTEVSMTQLQGLIARIDAMVGAREREEQVTLRRIAEYEQALREAIQALEQTKDSFRSRRLKLLRLRLAQVLEQGGEAGFQPRAE